MIHLIPQLLLKYATQNALSVQRVINQSLCLTVAKAMFVLTASNLQLQTRTGRQKFYDEDRPLLGQRGCNSLKARILKINLWPWKKCQAKKLVLRVWEKYRLKKLPKKENSIRFLTLVSAQIKKIRILISHNWFKRILKISKRALYLVKSLMRNQISLSLIL